MSRTLQRVAAHLAAGAGMGLEEAKLAPHGLPGAGRQVEVARLNGQFEERVFEPPQVVHRFVGEADCNVVHWLCWRAGVRA